MQRRHQPGDDAVGLGEDVAPPQLGHAPVERRHLRQPAAQHNDVRIDQVDHPGEGARQAVAVELEAFGGLAIA